MQFNGYSLVTWGEIFIVWVQSEYTSVIPPEIADTYYVQNYRNKINVTPKYKNDWSIFPWQWNAF